MRPDRWSRVRELYERAVELPPERRAPFLEESTGDDRELRAEVERLLDSDAGGETFLRPPARGRVARSFEAAPVELERGARLGAYRIVGRVGAGGMGTVYEAIQERPERTVALKVLRDPLAGEDARRRFTVEAEVLGRLRHPGIATVYEMGEELLEDGRSVPFFALELVAGGRDLVTYSRELPQRARLELFREVCAAVQHAHLSGVLHRDLKPANLLVDDEGRPKVIDYGVARAIDPAAVPAGLESRGDQIVGTLQYMAPEQLRGGSETVDARADVYALGLVLYELLAGARPYTLAGMPLAEVVETVCEAEVAPPSQHGSVPRELDWIVLRALEKDPERRYESAAELARDLGRYLADEPVTAAPPSAAYRLRKFVARNRIAVAAGALTFVGLAVAVIVTSLALVEARDQRDLADEALVDLGVETQQKQRALEELQRANEQTQLALNRQLAVTDALQGILSAVSPDEDGHKVTLFSLLERTRPRFEGTGVDPLQRAELSSLFAGAYKGLGLSERAGELYESALASLEQADDADPLSVVVVKAELAAVRAQQQLLDEAEELADECDALLEGMDGVSPKFRLELEVTWAMIAEGRGNYAEAEELYRDGLARYADSLPAGSGRVLDVRSRLGHTLLQQGRFGEARDVLEPALASAASELGENHWRTLTIGSRMTQTLHALGEHGEALELQERVVAGLEEFYGEHSGPFLDALTSLVIAQLGAGRPVEAAEAAERALALLEQHHPGDRDTETTLRGNYAVALGMQNRNAEAREQLERVVELLEAAGQGSGPRMFDIQHNLAETLMRMGELEEAEDCLLHAREIGQEAFGVGSWQEHFIDSRLAVLMVYTDRTEQGVEVFREAHAAMRSSDNELALLRASQTERSVGGLARRAEDLGQTDSLELLQELLEEWGAR